MFGFAVGNVVRHIHTGNVGVIVGFGVTCPRVLWLDTCGVLDQTQYPDTLALAYDTIQEYIDWCVEWAQ